MKKIIRAACMSATLSATVLASSAFAQVNLSVPLRTQEHSQWCWAGASQMVLQFKGKNVTQCAAVNYALGINYACGNTTFNWNSQANQPNSTSAITRILNASGVSATTTGVISQSYSNQYLSASRPYIILFSRFFIPFKSLCINGGRSNAIIVHFAKIKLSLGITLFC